MTRAKNEGRRRQRDFPLGAVVAAGLAAIGFGVAVAQFDARRAPDSAAAAGLAVGDPTPIVALPATTGGTLSLGQFRGTKVVVYFYEGSG